VALGSYADTGDVVGWLVMTPGKRVQTLHWVHVRQKLSDGMRVQNRRALALDLIAAAKLGNNFVYTLRGPRCRKESGFRTTDEMMVAALRGKGVTASYINVKEWLK
jgi:hypothetical protein